MAFSSNSDQQLASEFGEYFEKISSMLQQIGLHLNSLRRFPRLYPHNERLETAMVDVYRVIFRFCTDARNVFKKVSDKKISQKGRSDSQQNSIYP